ncbi:MAG: VWA domain-containing protein [Candidatus Delongbacteria bacterium]
MRTLLLCLGLLLCGQAHGFGVVVLDAENLGLLPPATSTYEIHVENQVALTRVHSEFINPLNHNLDPVWVFPLGVDASATRLRYRLNGSWHEVPIGVGPQDPGLPGDEIHPLLQAYMGPNPLIFHFENNLLMDSTLVVELDYVELLPYSWGQVSLRHPGNLIPILPGQIIRAAYDLTLVSDQTVESLALTSGHTGESVFEDDAGWHIAWSDLATYPDEDFTAVYQLSQQELGLFASSTMLPDSLMPEDSAPGFLMFRAQPDPDDASQVMDKVFTLIIDRSGSMGGNKIIQARNAAAFIVNHLNEGDRFNLISFASAVTAFQSEHVEYTPSTASQALSWISTLTASGSTNISGAFDTAVPQFDSADSTTANIILFFTDGVPTTGITNMTQLVQHVDALFDARPQPINLFCFGIGNDVNSALLGQLAVHNNGFAEFLANDELEARISAFYLRVRNPVLMGPLVSAEPAQLLELAPTPLPNLYLGEQLIVAARYNQAQPLTLTLSGTAFGRQVDYSYPVDLSASYDPGRVYLPKVWAKCRIESLMVQYSQLDPESAAALELQQDIIDLSLTWGVVSPFTSFNDDVAVPPDDPAARPASLLLVENHPNPFNPSTTLRVTVPAGLPRGPLLLRVYNLRGQLVRTLAVLATGAGVYELVWDGRDEAGREVASGPYLVLVSCADQVAAQRILLLR